MKKITTKKAKKKAWEAFSKFVRLRDAIKTTGTKDFLLCITCEKQYKAFGVGCAQAGHFIPGRGNSILIDEKFVHGQCYNCNHYRKGNWVIYEQKMLQMWGEEAVEEVKRRAKQPMPIKTFQWLELEQEYKTKYDELLFSWERRE
jgi:hypothetical protein